MPEVPTTGGPEADPAARSLGPPGPTGAFLAVEGPPPTAAEIRSFPLLQPLSPEVLQRLAASLRPQRFPAGERVLRQGERADRMHFLRSGRVLVEMRTSADVRFSVAGLGPGDCFGEMSLLTGEPASADVTAEEDAETLALDRTSFNALAAECPGLLREFTLLISRRLRTTGEAFVSSRQMEREVTRFLGEDTSGGSPVFVGRVRSSLDLEKRVGEWARSEAPLLLLGERGTGKELLARRIHYEGPRREAPLLAVDGDRITETPWGDSLFGDYHRRDARPHPRAVCYMDLAEGGTLLLKNVETLPPAVMERLGRYFSNEGEGPRRRRHVRILATLRGNPAGGGKSGGLARVLPPELAANALTIPPLRERKKDIPRLAEHFLGKHARRRGAGPRRLDDQALRKLVTHDYEHSNVRELEEAIRRAVILSEGEVISAEEIFLHRPGVAAGAQGVLLEIPRPLLRLALRAWPGALRGAVAVFFAAVFLACFLAPRTAAGEAALVLVWGAWWPALALSFLLLGRAWCSLCPMAYSGASAQRLATIRRQVPAFLKDRGPQLAAAGFLLVFWIEEATAMRHSPVATGFLLLGILAGAVATSLLYPRRTWCRHLCPLGGLAGACSTASILEIRPTPDVCEAKCTGHVCYKGDDSTAGCPMFHHVMFLDSSRDCILCLNCVKACPNSSPRVVVRLPAQELWRDLRARPESGWLAAVLAGLLPAAVLVQFFERVPTEPFSSWLHDHRVPVVTALFALLPAIPLLLLGARLRRSPGPERTFARLTPWLPLVAGGFAAYEVGFLAGLGSIETRLGYAPLGGEAERWLATPLLPLLQLGLMAVGFALALVILARRHPAGDEGRGLGALADTAAAAVGVALWFVLVAGLLVGASNSAAVGPWTAAAIVAGVGISFRLVLGFRDR